MTGRESEVLRIERNDNGSYTFELVELDIRQSATSPDLALGKALIIIRDTPGKLLPEDKERLAVLDEAIGKLNQQLNELETQRLELVTQLEPLVAKGLLEQREMCQRALATFRPDFFMAQHFGRRVRAIGFLPYKDIDEDGDMDFWCSWYFSKAIKGGA